MRALFCEQASPTIGRAVLGFARRERPRKMPKDRIRKECSVVKGSAQEGISCATDATQIVRLSAEDQRALAEAMLDPPPPTPALLRAARTYEALVKDKRSGPY
jgi:hypothetical protein